MMLAPRTYPASGNEVGFFSKTKTRDTDLILSPSFQQIVPIPLLKLKETLTGQKGIEKNKYLFDF